MWNEDNSIKDLDEKEPDQVNNEKTTTNIPLNGDIDLNYDIGENKKKRRKCLQVAEITIESPFFIELPHKYLIQLC